uniref:GOLD domain-containing protein n=1 Tax=Oryza nivara TaxID=4536 RepID=A0A0E0ID64_ORYNI
MAQRSVVLALALWCLVADGEAVWLELSTTATKCFSERIQSNVVVIGDYDILFDGYPTRPILSIQVILGLLLQVTSPYGKVLHHREKVMQGQFSFNTAEPGVYLACFSVDTLDKELGVALELTKLETAVQAVHGNLMYLRSKESDMRDVSDWTNFKITWLSLMSLSVCVIASIAQLWHLKRFFRKKKLI